MKVRKVFGKRLRRQGRGANVAGDVSVVVSANVNEPGSAATHVSRRERIVQRAGRTEVFDDEEAPKGER
jgi:hypothetical protein